MPLACSPRIDVQQLRAEISSLYSRVLAQPDAQYHFHRGPAYAIDFLGYESDELEALPQEVTRVFAGIGNPLKMGRANAGETILDIGCGAGMDLLLAALQAGPAGRAIGVDMTPGMLDCARHAAGRANLRQVELRLGDATSLPVDSASVDIIISNGVLNLVPEKEAALEEMKRVLKPGGRVQIADIALNTELSEDARADIDLWTGWIAGALLEAELVRAFKDQGFADVTIRDRFDCFEGTSKERTARRYGVHGVNLSARKLRE